MRPDFRLARWREVYDADEVTAFLDEVEPVVSSLPSPELAERIRTTRFTARRVRPGFDMGEVDLYLDELVDQVESAVAEREAADAGAEIWSGRPTFPRSGRLAKGYDPAQVSAFLDDAEQWIRRRPSPELAQRIRAQHFSAIRGGLDMASVDEYLDQLDRIASRGRA